MKEKKRKEKKAYFYTWLLLCSQKYGMITFCTSSYGWSPQTKIPIKKILMITIFYCNVAPHPSALKVGKWPLYKLLWMKYKCEIGFGIVNMHMIYNALQKV